MKEKRATRILEIINEKKRVSVKDLAAELGAAQSTIRLDLEALAAKGLVRREHGLAVSASEDDINNRLAINYAVKKRIAQKTAGLIEDGETVMIESGSCCALLAVEMGETKRDCRIITNSAFIAAYVRALPALKVTLLGGDYQSEAQVTVGPDTRKSAANYFVDKLFVGTDGFTERTGFTGNDAQRVEAVRDMASQAKQVIVLTESHKFRKQGVVPLLPNDKISLVITDDGIPEEMEACLNGHGVKVVKIALDA